MSKIENERKTVLTQLLLVFLLTTFQSLTLRQQQRITINKQNKNINHITHQVCTLYLRWHLYEHNRYKMMTIIRSLEEIQKLHSTIQFLPVKKKLNKINSFIL